MSENFYWNTEEDDWEGSHQDKVGSRPSKRRLLPIFVGMLFVIVVGVVLYVQTKRSLDEVEGAYTADIVSSYSLIKRSIDEGDSELFKTMLSGSDFDWTTAQQELFELGLQSDLRPLGLTARPAEFDVVGVDLNPEFSSAVVTVEQLYGYGSSDNEYPSVNLHNESIFRQGDRWLWSPPKDEFWDEAFDDEIVGEHLTIFFPKRDADIVERLQEDLNSLVDQWCQLNGKELCDELRIHIKFSRDPSSLLDLADQYYQTGYADKKLFFNGRAYTLSLPTPSLIGMPQDEESYKAILAGYASHLIGSLTAEIIGDGCCESDVSYHAMIRQQLAALALAPVGSGQGREFSTPGISPEYGLQLICQQRPAQSAQLVNYSWQRNQWQTGAGDRHIVDIRRSPSGDAVFLLEKENDSPQSTVRIIMMREDQEHILFEEVLPEETADLVSWRLPERENRLILEIPDVIRGASKFYNFDLSECGSVDCPLEIRNFLSTPIWSPNGDNLLVRQYEMLWWQQGFQAIALADGMAPFWVDNDSFGFVRKLENLEVIVGRNLEEDDYQRILETADLASALEQENRPNEMSIGHVAVDPADSNIWYILAFGLTVDGGAGEAFIFKLNRQLDDISLIVRSEKLHSFSLSPVGGKLSATLYDPIALSWNIITHEAQSNTTDTRALLGGYAQQIPPVIDWSPDGQWILALNQGLLILIDTVSGEQLIVSPPEAGCTRAVWAAD